MQIELRLRSLMDNLKQWQARREALDAQKVGRATRLRVANCCTLAQTECSLKLERAQHLLNGARVRTPRLARLLSV